MYTHTGGYKFCIGVDASGSDIYRGNSINVEMWAIQREYDNWLKWPAQANFIIEVIINVVDQISICGLFDCVHGVNQLINVCLHLMVTPVQLV